MKSESDIYDSHYPHSEYNDIHHTAIIYPNVKMGKGNKIGAYAVIGSDGEIRGVKEFKGWVEIGDDNVISELVTIQRPANENITKIGSNNIIMAHAHIGHDAVIGDGCEISTGSIIGGYATIEDGARVKLGVTIRNRKTVGKNATVGMGAVVVANVDAESIVVGNPAKRMK
jgi:UDP-N-acetylglucosamine acyltransferase